MPVNSAVLHVGWMSRAVAALLGTGLPVTCAVAPAQAAAVRAAGARAVVVSDPESTTDVLAGLSREGLSVGDFQAVCSGLEFCLLNAAVLAELGRLAEPGTFQRALGMRDKYVQKTIVRQAGVDTAACEVLTDLSVPGAQGLDFPFVLKPLNGGGAKDTRILAGEYQLREEAGRATPGSGPWLLEEFVSGADFKGDGFVRGGEIRLLSVARYLQNLIEIHDGGLVAHVVLERDAHAGLYADIRAVAETAFKALCLNDGAFHLEVFQRPGDGGIVFGECGARVGGGRTDEVVKLRYGIDLHAEWARAVLGLTPGEPDSTGFADGAIGSLNLPAPTGLALSVPSEDEVRARPGVRYADITLQPGAVMPDATVASNLRAGQAVVTGPTEQEVERRLRDLAQWFSAKVVIESS
jgi:biotin carboxylase